MNKLEPLPPLPNRTGYPDATIIISHWSSRCANCGRECDYIEKTHESNMGYAEEPRKHKRVPDGTYQTKPPTLINEELGYESPV